MRKSIQNQYISLIFIFFIIFFRAAACYAEFTIDDEKKLGKEFYDKMVKHHLLLENKHLNEYIIKIGNLVLKDNKKVPFDFHFSIVDDSAINAFATPGGYIYINKGLINAVENEAELAGVMAHEIGHANARHVASIIEKSQKLSIATLAAVLAGAFLGGGGAASAAIASFSVAGAASLNLKYSREHEEEADRMGIEYLSGAGYYPAAMVDFLKIMKKYEFLSKNIPSYLLTHPGTDERMFYLDSLVLTKYRQKGSKYIIGNLSRMQTLLILGGDDLNARYKHLDDSAAKDPQNVDLLYALALTEDKLGRVNEALNHYQEALRLSSRDEDILKSLGLMYLKIGKADQAIAYLQRAEAINADNDDIILALGKAYDAQAKYDKALEYYLKLENKKINDTDIHYYIAMTYGKLNIMGESHYNFGLYFKQLNKKDTALFHFKKALDFFPAGSQRANAIDKAINDLKSTQETPNKNPPVHRQKRLNFSGF